MSTSARAGRIFILTAGLLAPAAHAGNVFVVDTGGPALYHQIQPAVDAALDGDTVLVKSGTYSGFSIVDKRLSVVADIGQAVIVSGTVQVTNLAVSRDVVLTGFTVVGSFYGLELLNNAGSVRIQACSINGANMGAPFPDAVVIDGCNDVAFVRCTMRGGQEYLDSGTALRASNSTIALYDCILQGGEGYNSPCYPEYDGGSGGSGAVLSASFLFASGTSFQGGQGGDGGQNCGNSADGGNGGSGLVLWGVGSQGWILDCTFAAGYGGMLGCGMMCGYNCYSGVPSYAGSGASLTTIPGYRRRLLTPAVVREAPNLVPLTIQGLPGDTVSLIISRQASFNFVPNQSGVRLSPDFPPPVVLKLGVISSSGVLNRTIPSYDLGPGVESRTYQLQTVHRQLDGRRVLGSPESLVILDSSF